MFAKNSSRRYRSALHTRRCQCDSSVNGPSQRSTSIEWCWKSNLRQKASKLRSGGQVLEQHRISGAKLSDILQPMGELMSIAIHLLSLTGGLFKKANKWLRSPSFKVGQPRPSSSAFAYMRGP